MSQWQISSVTVLALHMVYYVLYSLIATNFHYNSKCILLRLYNNRQPPVRVTSDQALTPLLL